MANDPDPAAAARAARLREQIEKLKNPGKGSPQETANGHEKESPREFIHRRMSELDKKEQG